MCKNRLGNLRKSLANLPKSFGENLFNAQTTYEARKYQFHVCMPESVQAEENMQFI